MFWKENIVISEQIYQFSGPAIYVCRIFGLFPVRLWKEKDQIYCKWSPYYALYSVFIALFLTVFNYRGILEDILSDRKESVRIKANVDIYVVFTDLSGVQLIMIFGIFAAGCKISEFFKFLKCLGEIDAIMHLNPKPARRASICIIILLLLVTVSMCTADLLMWYLKTADDIPRSKVVKRYLTVYVIYCVVLMSQYRFWHLGNAILRRLRKLNKKINSFIKNDAAIELISHNSIATMTNIYMKLYEATNLLNQFSGLTNTVTTLDILWHFVETPYHLLSEITGPRKDPEIIAMMVAWFLFHISRLLILVEPCNAFKLELQGFSSILIQCKPQFSAAGLNEIDRSLITSLVATVSTYLVVLLQFQYK